MAEIHRTGRIELSDDVRFTRKSWIVERAGWATLIAVIVVALLGGFGPGFFSRCTAAGDAIVVEYDRFGNFRTEEELTVRLTPRLEDRGRVSFRIGQSFLDAVSVEDVRPEPLEVNPEPDGTTFVFPAPANAAPVTVQLDVIPTAPGRVRGWFGRPGRAGVEVRRFIYP